MIRAFKFENGKWLVQGPCYVKRKEKLSVFDENILQAFDIDVIVILDRGVVEDSTAKRALMRALGKVNKRIEHVVIHINDQNVVGDKHSIFDAVGLVLANLRDGKNVAICCKGGTGRSVVALTFALAILNKVFEKEKLKNIEGVFAEYVRENRRKKLVIERKKYGDMGTSMVGDSITQLFYVTLVLDFFMITDNLVKKL